MIVCVHVYIIWYRPRASYCSRIEILLISPIFVFVFFFFFCCSVFRVIRWFGVAMLPLSVQFPFLSIFTEANIEIPTSFVSHMVCYVYCVQTTEHIADCICMCVVAGCVIVCQMVVHLLSIAIFHCIPAATYDESLIMRL